MIKISINNVSFNVDNNNLEFWDLVENNKWEKDTFTIFDRFLTEDTIYFDIGAWIGPTVLYATQLSKQAFAFEPDPVAFNVLKTNLSLNENTHWHNKLTLYNKAVGTENGYIHLGSKSSGGDSGSSVLITNDKTQWRVETLTIHDLIESKNLKNERLFFKIDIEGGEYSLIPVLNEIFSTQKITLFLSFHPKLLFGSIKNERKNIFRGISNRLKVIKTHLDILGSLPFRFFYLQNGKKLNTMSLLYKTIRLKFFSIVASNEEWK